MAFLRSRILLVSSLLVTVLMLVGVGMVSYDALTIREAEEVEEDTSKLLLHAEQWMNHQEEIEVALRNYVLAGNPKNLAAIEKNRLASMEHVQGMRQTLSEYLEDAEEQINGLLKFRDKHQRLVDRIVAARTAGDIKSASQALASDEAGLYIYATQLILENLTHTLQEKRSRYNSEVSMNVLHGSISFALMALLMISVIWVGYAITAKAQRKNAQLTAQLEFEATHDALTGLPNRRYMHDHIAHALDLATRHKLRLALMVLDLDGFKAINDAQGHDAGDFVLKEVTERFKQTSRVSDFIVRTGGDEFAVIAENVERTDSLQSLAQRLIDCLAEPVVLPNRKTVVVGCSIGIAIYPEHAANIDLLFTAADQAMYAAKESGKNRWRMAAP